MIAMTFPIAELRDRNLSPFPMSSNGKYMICSAAVICRILLAINAKRIPAMTSIRAIILFPVYVFFLCSSSFSLIDDIDCWYH